MKKWLKYLFETDKHPHKGLYMVEWAMVVYLVLTLLLMLFMQTKIMSFEPMLWGRVRILMTTAAMWAVYRMVPCRAMLLLRISVQMALLSWWYPDTYEFNRLLPNLDHHFAAFEQSVFGSQPALWLHERFSSPVVSELLNLGYVSYYPLILVVSCYYFLLKFAEFGRSTFIIFASFMVFYCVFIALPVAGPQYYYQAVGLDEIARGVFPNIGNYFETHQESLPIPGWKDGLFYQMLVDAHNAGERPTAAFPSSHVGITTVIMFLAWRTGSRRLFWWLMPFFVLMFFATFYIQAHYVIDAIAGLFAGTVFYFLTGFIYDRLKRP